MPALSLVAALALSSHAGAVLLDVMSCVTARRGVTLLATLEE